MLTCGYLAGKLPTATENIEQNKTFPKANIKIWFLSFYVAEGEVPGSAVLLFDIELLDLVSGLPEGYMFVWNDEVSPNLFEEIDKDNNGEILLEEVRNYFGGEKIWFITVFFDG